MTDLRPESGSSGDRGLPDSGRPLSANATHWIAIFPALPGTGGSTAAPNPVEVTTAALLQWLETPQAVARKHDASLVFLGDIRGCGRKDATAFAPLLAVDVDDGHAPVGWVPPDTFGGVGYTTASSTPEAPRYRLVIELDRPPLREEIKPATRAAAALLGLGHDGCTESGSQGIYPPIAGATVWRRHGAPWSVDALVAAGGGVVEAPRRRGAGPRPDDREPVHPAGLAERYARWVRAIAGLSLPAVADTSGTLTGERGMVAVRRFVFAGINHGVPEATIVEHLARVAAPLGWDADDVEAAVGSAWYYSTKAAVAWESELPPAGAPIGPGAVALEHASGVLLTGAPGAGKTTLVCDLTRDDVSLLWVAPRVKLARDAATRAGAVLYGEPGDDKAERLATTTASLRKYTDRAWDVVVVDEAATCMLELNARAYQALQYVCARARVVLVLGADIDAAILAAIDRVVGRPLAHVELASPHGPLVRKLEIRHANAVISEILAPHAGRATLGGCRFIACDTSVRAQALGRVLESLGQRVAVFVGGDESVPTNATVESHDYIIATHSMAEAINLTARIERVFVLHTFDSVHPRTLLQLAARARNVADPTIIVGEPAWEVRPPRIDAEDLAYRIIGLGGDVTPAGALECRWLRDHRRADAKHWPSLRDHAAAVGWSVDPTAAVEPVPMDPHWGPLLRQYGDAIRDADAAEVVAQRQAALERLPVRPSPEQRAAHAAWQLLEVGLDVTPDNARADRDGRLRAAVRRRALERLASEGAAAFGPDVEVTPGADLLGIVAEALEPHHRADRDGLAARARADAAMLAAWAEYKAAGECTTPKAPRRRKGDETPRPAPCECAICRWWYVWARAKHRLLTNAGIAVPSRARSAAWAKSWHDLLTKAPAGAVDSVLAGWVLTMLSGVVRVPRRGTAPTA